MKLKNTSLFILACFCLISCMESEQKLITDHIKTNLNDPKSFELTSIWCFCNPTYQAALDSAIVEYQNDIKKYNPKYETDRWNIERCNRCITSLDSLKKAHPELMGVTSSAKLYNVEYRANNTFGGKVKYRGLYRIRKDGFVHGDSFDDSFTYSVMVPTHLSLTREWAREEIPGYNEFIEREKKYEAEYMALHK